VIFCTYDASFGPPNLETEIEQLLDSRVPDAEVAAARFFVAMDRMKTDGRSYGTPVPIGLMMSLSLTPNATVKTRASKGYQLYFSFIARPAAPTGEARMLMVAAHPAPVVAGTVECERRHNAITVV
jgi:hypothetical protein